MHLIADIGATNSRCALLDDDGKLSPPIVLANADFAGPVDVLRAYLSRQGVAPRRAALALAAPISGDHIEMLNIDWAFSRDALRRALDLDELLIINDFEALAWSLPTLEAANRRQIGGGTAIPGAAHAVIGPGSGLGVASLIPAGGGWTAVSSEGGHVTLPASTDEEAEAIASIRRAHGHCSAERVLSGPGLLNLHRALAEIAGRRASETSAAEITAGARRGDAAAAASLEMFFCLLGTVAADLALTVGARGGVYIGGGIVPRFIDLLEHSGFRRRFVDKGRYRDYLEAVPTYVITDPYPAMRGLRAWLAAQPPKRAAAVRT